MEHTVTETVEHTRSTRKHSRRAATLTVLAVALVSNFWIFFNARSFEEHTTLCSASYLTLGQNLLHGKGFVNQYGGPESRHTPGYPLFIATVLRAVDHHEAVIFVQHLLIVLLALGVFEFTRRATDNLTLATVAGALCGSDLSTTWISNQIMAEALFTLVIFVVTVLTWKITTSARAVAISGATGLLIGAVVLVKPIAILYAVPMALYVVIFARRARFRAAVVLLLCAALLPGYWAMRNKKEKGVATITSIAGENMLTWRAAGALAIGAEPKLFPYTPVPLPDEEFVRRFYRQTQPAVNALAERELQAQHGDRASQLNDAQRSVIQGRLGRRILLANPLDSVRVAVYGILHVLFDGPWEAASSLSGSLFREPLMYLLFVVSVCSAVLAALGFATLYRHQPRLFWLILLCVGYFLGMAAGMEAESRFRVPFTPFYSIAIAQGAVVAASMLSARRRSFSRTLTSTVSDPLLEAARRP